MNIASNSTSPSFKNNHHSNNISTVEGKHSSLKKNIMKEQKLENSHNKILAKGVEFIVLNDRHRNIQPSKKKELV